MMTSTREPAIIILAATNSEFDGLGSMEWVPGYALSLHLAGE